MNLVIIKNFATYSEAGLAKNLLEKYGIKSVIQKGYLAAGAEFSGFAGDADIFISDKDYEKAREILGIKNYNNKS